MPSFFLFYRVMREAFVGVDIATIANGY